MKRFLILLVAVCLLGGFAPLPASAKTSPEAARLSAELQTLLTSKNRTKEDWRKGLETARKLLEIIDKSKNIKLKGTVLGAMAMCHYSLGEYRTALPLFEKAAALQKSAKDPQGEKLALTALALTHERLAQNLDALQAYNRVLEIARKLKDRKEESFALYRIGKVYRSRVQDEKAIEYFERSLALDRELKDRKSEATKLHALGVLYAKRYNYDKALDYYVKANVIYRSFDDRSQIWKILTSLGNLYRLWGQYDKALDYHQQALQITEQLKRSNGQASCHINIGNVYLDWGEYDKAMDHYNRSLSMYTELWSQSGQATCFSNIANLYQKRGQYDKAVDLYKEALEIRTHSWNQLGQAACYANLGSLYEQWGQYDRAMDLYRESLDIRTELKMLSAQTYPLMGIGRLHLRKGEYQEALAKFQQALKILADLNVPTLWPTAAIAGVYLDLGEISLAESYVPALKAAYKNQRNQTGLWSFMGRLCLLKSDFSTSKEYYDKLLSFAKQNQSAGDLFTAYTGIGFCQEGLGNLAAASDSFRKAVIHTEEVRSTISQEQREMFFDVSTGGFRRTEPYQGLARVLTKMHKPEEAFRNSEFTKARVFAETMARSLNGYATNVPPEVLKADEDLNNRLSALKGNRKAAYERGSSQAVAALDPQIKALEAQQQAHVNMLRKNYPLFAATKYPQPIDLSETALTENDWVLSYDVTDPGLIIYLCRGKALRKAFFKPVQRKELDTLVRKFRTPLDIKPEETIADKIVKFDFSSGKKLADILLADILPELPKDAPLIIVPADCLGILPFEMLVLNDGGKIVRNKGIPNTSGAEFFGDRNPISYYQSVTALTLARNFSKQKVSGNKTLVMCDPVYSADDPRVVERRREERQAALASLTNDVLMSAKTQNHLIWNRMALTKELGASLKKADPDHTDLYEGLQATKAAFMHQNLEQYQNIVFATHGYAGMDLGGLKEPVLVLTLVNQPKGEDGFLRMSEVMGLKMNADIVALTACQSGMGKRISGEGTLGMGRAFQYAGAKSTLMTLWSVAQKSSVQLTERFFKHLKEGKSKIEALKLARDEIRKDGYNHPFFWSSFILVGEVN